MRQIMLRPHSWKCGTDGVEVTKGSGKLASGVGCSPESRPRLRESTPCVVESTAVLLLYTGDCQIKSRSKVNATKIKDNFRI